VFFKLVFENSNDTLSFESDINSDILTYYVDNLNKQGQNKFKSNKTFMNQNLTPLINEINEYFEYYTDYKFDVYKDHDYFNHHMLNKLHADWANAQFNIKVDVRSKGLLDHYPDDNLFPDWNNVLYKIGKVEQYNSLNTRVHQLERQFDNIRYSTDNKYLRMDNPFSKDRCTNDICNFKLAFNHLGRTLYNKFNTLDDALQANDENTFNELLGDVDISLCRPQTIPLSKEYVEWCKKLNKIPSGEFLNIGNLIDYKNKLTDHKQIVYNNKSNSFTIKIEEK
jgi:hypothetical protein